MKEICKKKEKKTATANIIFNCQILIVFPWGWERQGCPFASLLFFFQFCTGETHGYTKKGK